MEDGGFHLIPTSLWERKNSNKSLFLGEWCLSRELKKELIGSNIDYKIFSQDEVDLPKKYRDLTYCYKVVDQISPLLAESLNIVTGKNYSNEEWFILLGPLLQNFVTLLLNRYNDIKKVVSEEKVTSVECYCYDLSNMSGSDTLGYHRCVSNQNWNQVIYQYILDKINFEMGQPEKKLVIRHTPTKINNSLKGRLKNFFFSIFSIFTRYNDTFIKNSYMSFKDELKLSVSLGLVPALYNSPEVGEFDFNELVRKKMSIEIDKRSEGLDEFSKIYFSLLAWILPKCFVEGVTLMEDRVRHLGWPKNPKFIFTSNAYAYDEYFKFYVVLSKSNGAKYIIGQHGANYGTYKSALEWYEFKTADIFLSWGKGLKSMYNEVIPAFNFKVKKEMGGYLRDGKLLFVQRGPGHRDGPQDRFIEHIYYQKFTRDFYSSLDGRVKSESVVRLHHGSIDFDTEDKEAWDELCEKGGLDFGGTSIWDLFSKSRLVVFGYDSSGFWECMSLNIPTLCLWNGGLDHVEKEYLWLYRELEEVGLYYSDYEKCSKFINESWEDIDYWWNSFEVQAARENFCQNFSRLSLHPAKELTSILKSIIKRGL